MQTQMNLIKEESSHSQETILLNQIWLKMGKFLNHFLKKYKKRFIKE